MVELGPHFKVRKYIAIHSCSKPMMGTAHPQASTRLIVDFIEERVRCNNNIRPKEIISEY